MLLVSPFRMFALSNVVDYIYGSDDCQLAYLRDSL